MKRQKLTILADISWAGELQANILSQCGYKIVQGSSKRNGSRALLKTINNINDGLAAIFALDGPRGPIYKSKPGIIFLSQRLNLPIVPITSSAEKSWIVKKSWCQYVIPKPFSSCDVYFGAPLSFSDVSVEQSLRELDDVMNECTRMADLENEKP